MYRQKLINKYIVDNSTKYFKVINQEGEILEWDKTKASLYIPSGFWEEWKIIFNVDDVYKGLDYSAKFNPSSYGIGILFDYKKHFGSNIKVNATYEDYTELDYWKFYISTVPDLSYKTKKAYIKNLPYSITKRRGRQFDRLFKTGVSIDLNHIHGGDHNKYNLFHVSDEYNYGVKWLSGFFGLPYGCTVRREYPAWRKDYIKFDSSGGDLTKLSFMRELFDITANTGKRGKALLAELGGCVVSNKDGELFDWKKEPNAHMEFQYDPPGVTGTIRCYSWIDEDGELREIKHKYKHVWDEKRKRYIRGG